MNVKPAIWFLFTLLLALTACTDQGSSIGVAITKPSESQITNGTLDVRLELTDSKPDDLNSLSVTLERRKSSAPDVDASYADIKTFYKNQPYPFTYQWDTNSVLDGEYVLRAKATYTLGGFDGQPRTSTSAPRTVTIDRTRPSVVSSTPTPDAGNVLVKDPITVVFNKAVLVSSLTDESVKLFAGVQQIGRTVRISSDGKTVTVTPGTPPSTPNKLRLEVSESVTDTLGNKLIPKAWSWTVPAWVRLGELRSSVPGVTSALLGSFQVGKDGNPVALWRGHKPGENTDTIYSSGLYVSQWNGKSWTALDKDLRSTVPNAVGANGAYLKLDSGDRPVVAWLPTDGPEAVRTTTADVRVSRWNGSAWLTTPGVRSTRANLNINTAVLGSLTLDDKDNPVVGWEGGDTARPGPAQNAMFINKWNGSNWESLGEDFRKLVPGIITAFGSFPFLDADKNLVVFWSGAIADYSSDSYAYKWDAVNQKWQVMFGGSLKTSLTQSRIADDGGLTSVLLDNGQYLLTGVANGKFFVAHQTGSSTWTRLGANPTTALDALNAQTSSFSVDSSNTLVGAFTGATQGYSRVTLLSFDGSTWIPIPNPPPQPGAINGTNFASEVRRGPDGSLYVSWQEVDPSGATNITIYRENR